MTGNLLKNPNGEDELEFWELTENGGSQWKVEEMPGDCGYDFCNSEVTKYFATSFELCLKRQVIDLFAEGFTAAQLDAQPAVRVEDWYCGRTDCGCTYQMTAALLDENHLVIQEFKPETVTLDPDCDDCSWRQWNDININQVNKARFVVHPQENPKTMKHVTTNGGNRPLDAVVSHTFTDYGPGLSYISFEHGGQDTKFWDGWFGVRVTGSSVTVEV